MYRFCSVFVPIITLFLPHFAFAGDHCVGQPGKKMQNDTLPQWAVFLEFDETKVPLSAPFTISFKVCSPQPEAALSVDFDATMPAHKHGMNYQPEIVEIEGRFFEVNNLIFHMPGLWKIEITVFDDGAPHRFTHDVNVR